jgi:pimeloyl-ACP methyl ester carboxylesterase
MLESITIGRLTALAAPSDPSAPPRPPILFIHGYLGGAWVFENYLEFFSGRGHTCVAVNLRGRGGSALPPGSALGKVSIDNFVADATEAAQFITAKEQRPIVLGHSMGGLIAQKLAEQGDARAAVLVCPCPPRGISLVTGPLFRRQLKYAFAIMRSRQVKPRWRDVRDILLNRIPPSEQRTAFERFVPDSGRAGREMSFGAIAVNETEVRGHGCPMLVVSCDDDRFIPLRIAQKVANKYRAPLFVARKHGHLLPVEPGWQDPASFVADWVARETASGLSPIAGRE